MKRETQIDLILAAQAVTDYYFESDSGIDWEALDELMHRLEKAASKAVKEVYSEK